MRGQSGFLPFAPGGLEDITKTAEIESRELAERERGGGKVKSLSKLVDFRSDGGLLTVPPGFARGLKEELLEEKLGGSAQEEAQSLVDEKSVDEMVGGGEKPEDLTKLPNGRAKPSRIETKEEDDADLLLPVEFPSLAPRKALPTGREIRPGKQWAHNIDVNRPFPNFRELVPDMAREWPFELDTFQKEAVYHLEMGDSVFVAAHTSAGKTVVAEYAIALAAKHMTKAIYTSPIKALSNQKFRDFRNEFEDVGILTGDVQINPEASCLIMTTEILRSMLYRGADLIRDVEYVIFDEVHYVNDLERGVVWEEVIIMLPEHVTLILLSATVPNTFEFASWVGRTKKKDVYVISTPKRPVPLEHYLWGSKRLFKIVDSEKRFVEKGWKDANDALSGRDKIKVPVAGDNHRGGAVAAGRGGRGGGPAQRGRGQPQRGGAGGGTFSRPGHAGIRNTAAQDRTLWVQLVQHLRREDLLPACVFVFSKKRCEENADALGNQDYTTATEKSAIHMTIEKSILRLKPEDRTLPQILRVRAILARGLAVHHGGLLPIVKELVEILFAQGLVKVLFATETFAMGLNLPTRTVVFSGYRKHDGHSFRDLLAGEYTQMAGRAGRRGLDAIGTVIIVASGDGAPPAGLLRTMILGTPTKLRSQFRLTYNMILSLLRVEALGIEDMIKRSFSENATQALLPRHERDIGLEEEGLRRIRRPACVVCDADLESCYAAAERFEGATRELHRGLLGTPVGRRTLVARRLVVYRRDGGIRCAGLLLRDGVSRGYAPSLQVLELGSTGLAGHPSDLLPFLPAFEGFFPTLSTPAAFEDLRPLTVPLEELERITSTSIKVSLDAVLRKDPSALAALAAELAVLKAEWPSSSSPSSSPSPWAEYPYTRLKDLTLHTLLQTRQIAASECQQAGAPTCPAFLAHYAMQRAEAQIRANISALRSLLSSQNLQLLPDYGQRLAVLRDLGFIVSTLPAAAAPLPPDPEPHDLSSSSSAADPSVISVISGNMTTTDRLTLKGKLACEIRSTPDELVLTELVLENVLAAYEPADVCALLSAFVCQEKLSDTADASAPSPDAHLEAGVQKIMALGDKVAGVQLAHQVLPAGSSGGAGELAQADRRRFGLVNVVRAWARGESFQEIMTMTEVLEGTIVRVVTRLDECLREVRDAARVVGDAALFEKMERCRGVVRRDVMVVASLYM